VRTPCQGDANRAIRAASASPNKSLPDENLRGWIREAHVRFFSAPAEHAGVTAWPRTRLGGSGHRSSKMTQTEDMRQNTVKTAASTGTSTKKQ